MFWFEHFSPKSLRSFQNDQSMDPYHTNWNVLLFQELLLKLGSVQILEIHHHKEILLSVGFSFHKNFCRGDDAFLRLAFFRKWDRGETNFFWQTWRLCNTRCFGSYLGLLFFFRDLLPKFIFSVKNRTLLRDNFKPSEPHRLLEKDWQEHILSARHHVDRRLSKKKKILKLIFLCCIFKKKKTTKI